MNDNAKKWVEALRSNKFEQGTGSLVQEGGDVKHCCLGVLCEVYIEENGSGTLERKYDEYYFSVAEGWGYDSVLPPEVKEWSGLRTESGAFDRLKAAEIAGELNHDSLIELNDDAEWTFDQIADFIESEPAGLFE